MYANAVPAPEHVSTATIGRRSYLVIARLVLPNADEVWTPARAVRWTAQHVMVCIEPDRDQEPVYVWLPADDVRRTIHVPAAPAEPAAAATELPVAATEPQALMSGAELR